MTIKIMKRQAIGCLTKHIANKECAPKIYKELLKFINYIYICIYIYILSNKICAKDMNKHITKGDIQKASKHVKRCSTSYAIYGIAN